MAGCGELIFATGPRGVSASIVGEFVVRQHGDEYRLEVGDGTQHIHIDWSRVKRVEIGDHDREGMLTFFDGDERLFRLYRPAGPYPPVVDRLVGGLIRSPLTK